MSTKLYSDYGIVTISQDLVYEDWASGLRLMDNLEIHRIANENIITP